MMCNTQQHVRLLQAMADDLASQIKCLKAEMHCDDVHPEDLDSYRHEIGICRRELAVVQQQIKRTLAP